MSATSPHRRPPDDWTALIEAYLASGQTQKAFCEQHGINYYSFRHRYQSSPLFRGKRRQPCTTGFQRVSVPDVGTTTPGPWIVRCGDRVRIDCPADASVEAVVRLVRGLTDVA